MSGITGEMKGDKLVLTIDCGAEARVAAEPSSSGKTLILQSTRGKMRFGDVDIMLNALLSPKVRAVKA